MGMKERLHAEIKRAVKPRSKPKEKRIARRKLTKTERKALNAINNRRQARPDGLAQLVTQLLKQPRFDGSPGRMIQEVARLGGSDNPSVITRMEDGSKPVTPQNVPALCALIGGDNASKLLLIAAASLLRALEKFTEREELNDKTLVRSAAWRRLKKSLGPIQDTLREETFVLMDALGFEPKRDLVVPVEPGRKRQRAKAR